MATEKIIVPMSSQSVDCERCRREQALYMILECNERGEDATAVVSCKKCLTKTEMNALVGIEHPEDPIKCMTESQVEEYWLQKQQANTASDPTTDEAPLSARDILGDLAVEVDTADLAIEADEDEDEDEDEEAVVFEAPEDIVTAPEASDRLICDVLTTCALTHEDNNEETFEEFESSEDSVEVEERAACTYEQLLAKVTSALTADHSGRYYHLVMHMAEQVLGQRVIYDDDYEEFRVTPWDSIEDAVVEDAVLA